MKHKVDCPNCGSLDMRMIPNQSLSGQIKAECLQCRGLWTERFLLAHMRTKKDINRNAPAFWALDIKPRGKSDAARRLFG